MINVKSDKLPCACGALLVNSLEEFDLHAFLRDGSVGDVTATFADEISQRFEVKVETDTALNKRTICDNPKHRFVKLVSENKWSSIEC